MTKFTVLQQLLILILVFQFTNAKAQMGLAVSINYNGSSVKYALETGSSVKEASTNAVKVLEVEEAKNIERRMSEGKSGHELNEGYYVLILASRKNGGRFFLSYGLGGSEVSHQDAEKKALIHLKEWDLGYENDFGYSIEKKGKIEDLFPSEEE
ncbi:MAG: hypothetical protein DRJ10_07395 [Bacteroidetes bacterium]|nr:MAG: hypothetical protein DRJ10_07395 [Bacteroidota bacterium]